jgi:predicted Zn-dependent peptidase
MLHVLANGVAVIVLPRPPGSSAAVGAFVRYGSAHESRALSGIGHVLEHMAFKGTAKRDARRINLDAERLGAEVNAHTDKDHVAYHMRGLAEQVPTLVAQLGDLVRHATLPAAELERERQVLLQEYAEDEDDPLSTAFKLFDRASFGLHPVAQPVIGTRANIERFTRAQLLAHMQAGYTGCNLVLAAAGPLDADAVLRAAEAAFGDMPAGTPNEVAEPAWHGGLRAKGQPGSQQSHLVLGWPLPALRQGAQNADAARLAAAVLGEGMSSPLLDTLREQRGLAYYSACSADVLEMCGQFVIEVSCAPDSLEDVLRTSHSLVRGLAEHIAPEELQRARHQLAVRAVSDAERPLKLIEQAALDWFALGQVLSPPARSQALAAVPDARVRECFAQMLAHAPAVALAGKVPRGSSERLGAVLAGAGPGESAGRSRVSRR